jgi:hypothetical protein
LSAHPKYAFSGQEVDNALVVRFQRTSRCSWHAAGGAGALKGVPVSFPLLGSLSRWGTARMTFRYLVFLLALVISAPAFCSGGPLGIDHRLHYDNSGIWARGNQKALMYGTVLTVAGGARGPVSLLPP